jgi:hypothetical protein
MSIPSKEEVEAAVAALRSAKQEHGHDSQQAAAARAALAALLQSASDRRQ